jgi:hypothetical protein
MNKETLTVYTEQDGIIIYRNADGERHNPYGPAVILADGEKEHYINGKLHNENGPAIVCANGDKFYYINDQPHNPHGPAIIWANGYKAYWIKGKKLTEAEFTAWRAEQTAPLHNKTKVIDGIEYKLTAI